MAGDMEGRMDLAYGGRILAALSETVDRVSTDRINGSVRLKPFETALALTTLAGRIIGFAEHQNEVIWSTDVTATIAEAIEDERTRTRQVLALDDMAAAGSA